MALSQTTVTTHPTATHPTLPQTAPTHAPITHGTPALASTVPTTKKPEPELDPKLKSIIELVANLTLEINQVDKAFELSAAMENTIELIKLLDVIKQVQKQFFL